MTRRETSAMQSGPTSEAQQAVIRDLASITARSDLHDRQVARRPLVIGEPGFIAGTAIAFIVLCPLALAAMENLNRVTFFLAVLISRIWVTTEREVERYRREHLGRVGPKPKRPKHA
jgi:hypothetical protein